MPRASPPPAAASRGAPPAPSGAARTKRPVGPSAAAHLPDGGARSSSADPQARRRPLEAPLPQVTRAI